MTSRPTFASVDSWHWKTFGVETSEAELHAFLADSTLLRKSAC